MAQLFRRTDEVKDKLKDADVPVYESEEDLVGRRGFSFTLGGDYYRLDDEVELSEEQSFLLQRAMKAAGILVVIGLVVWLVML